MRTTVLLIFGTIFSSSIFGQSFDFQKKQNFSGSYNNRRDKSDKMVGVAPERNRINRNSHLTSYKTEKQRLDSVVGFQWNSTDSLWFSQNIDEYYYDSNGYETMIIYYYGGNQGGKYEYTYDAGGNKTLQTYYEWNSASSEWVLTEKYEYTYNTNGECVYSMDYSWNSSSSEWVSTGKYENTYDGNGHQLSWIFYLWDANNSQWKFCDKVEYSYNTSGNLITWIYYEYNTSLNQWDASQKNDYSYDAEGNLTLEIYNTWNSGSNQWQANNKVEFSYDDSENLSVSIFYEWNSNSGQWVASEKDEYTYNNEYSFNELVLPIDFENLELYHHMLNQSLNYYYSDNDWVLIEKYDRYYSSQNYTGIPENRNAKGVTPFPNPASNYLTFSVNGTSKILNLELFDFLGRQIVNQKICNNVPFSIQNLNKGLYLYKLNNDGNITIGKLQKE